MSGWDALWKRRAIPPSQGSTLADLMAADGLDSGFAGLSEASWSASIRRLAADLSLTPGTSVFEVGCGAGAVLYEIERLGCEVGGVDLSPALVGKAAEAIPSGRFEVSGAAALQVTPQVDAVISFGVFLYFSSLAYAAQVLDRMVEKARRVVAVLDVPDLATREEDLAYRHKQAGGEAAYEVRYAGLDHRYYDRSWLADALRARGLVDVHVEDQAIDGYGNAPFRFNAWGFVAR
jgi:trans-aconitate methyltransferase